MYRRFRSEEEEDAYWDAKYEAAQLEHEGRIEREWDSARDDCLRLAREAEPDASEEEQEELAREIFENDLEHYIDPCGCSDPCCPCSGSKRGVP